MSTLLHGGSIIAATDMHRMKQSIIPLQMSQEQVHGIELQKISKARAEKWTNTLAGSRRKKAQMRLERFESEEKAREKIDAEEAAIMLDNRRRVVNAANTLIFNENDRTKSFHSQMMYSDVIAEREAQMELTKELNKLETLREERFLELDKHNYRNMLEREIREKKEAEERTKEQSAGQREQRERKKEKEQKEKEQREHESMLIRLKAVEDLENEQAMIAKKKTLERESHQASLRVANYSKELQNKEEQRIIEEEIRIAEYAEEKQRMADLRKEKEKSIKDIKMAERQKMIDAQGKLLSEMVQNEDKRIQSQVDKKEEQERKKLADKEAERRQWEKDILKSRKQQMEVKVFDRRLQVAEDMEVAEFWKEYGDQLTIDEKKDELVRRRICKDLQRDHLRQAELTRRKNRESRRVELKIASRAKHKLDQEDNDFHKYAEEIIVEYAENGKNVIPMVRNLKEYHTKSEIGAF